MTAPSLRELRAMSRDELIQRHDVEARDVQPSLNYYLAELARRDQDEQTQAMLAYTKRVTAMTVTMTILTGIIMVLTIVQVWATLSR